MTTQFQRNVADKVCAEIENAQDLYRCLTEVDDFNDWGGFSCFMKLPIREALHSSIILHQDVNLRKTVAAIKRVCNKHPFVYDLNIVCPKKIYHYIHGFKIDRGYESKFVQISFNVKNVKENNPLGNATIHEKRNSVPFAD